MQRVFAENVVQRWFKGDAKRAVKETKRLSTGKTGTPRKQTEQETNRARNKEANREAEKQRSREAEKQRSREANKETSRYRGK